MSHPLLDVTQIDRLLESYLTGVGEIFARFDVRTQDSGNSNYGIRIGDGRYFVKTAGLVEEAPVSIPAPVHADPCRRSIVRGVIC